MGQVMEALHRLQAVERRLAEIRRDEEAKVRRIDHHKRLARNAEEKLQETRLRQRTRQVRLDALQLDVGAREDSVARHRQALNKAKTNKEYAAILTAMNTEKADNAKLETEILQLMEETQTLDTQANGIEEEKRKVLADVARTEEALSAFDAQSQSERKNLEAKRDEFAKEIPPSTLITFTRVAEHRDGEVLVPVSKMHPKRDDYVCSGCNITLTLEDINMLKMRDEIQICRVCGRILYWEDAPGQQARL